jgi:hypothetical protein
VTQAALADSYAYARSLRRLFTSGAAILGLGPVVHALAPRGAPSLVHAVTSLWLATMLALATTGLEELILARQLRHSDPSAE